jgi:hypothetical protein
MIKKVLMLAAALLVAFAGFATARPERSRAINPAMTSCPTCLPGYVSTGPPTCKCVRG